MRGRRPHIDGDAFKVVGTACEVRIDERSTFLYRFLGDSIYDSPVAPRPNKTGLRAFQHLYWLNKKGIAEVLAIFLRAILTSIGGGSEPAQCKGIPSTPALACPRPLVSMADSDIAP